MARFLSVVLRIVAGFVVAAILGYFLVSSVSSNTHDLSIEAAMTAVFVFGPIGAIGAGVWAFFRR